MGAFFVAYYWSNEQQLKLVADSEGQEKKTSVANDESKRYRLGKGPAHRVEERAQVCYGYILEGGTRYQICQRVADRFGVSHRTAQDD